jgi:hypothetical protein
MPCRLAASSVSSGVVEIPPEGRANTRSMAINDSRMPPAVRRAAREMPKLARMMRLNMIKHRRIAPPTNVPLRA